MSWFGALAFAEIPKPVGSAPGILLVERHKCTPWHLSASCQLRSLWFSRNHVLAFEIRFACSAYHQWRRVGCHAPYAILPALTTASLSTMTTLPSLTKVYHNDVYPSINPALPGLSMKGKTVAITGGGGGIGAATALAFATAGAKVAILGRTKSTLSTAASKIQAQIPNAVILTVAADISSETDINAAFEKIHDAFGPIDIFISNAAIAGISETIADSNPDSYWKVFETNTKGPLLCLQAFLKVTAPDAIVINVSSGVAHIPAIPTVSAYAASKLPTVKIFDVVQAENPGLHVVSLQPAIAQTGIQTAGREVTEVDKAFSCTDTVELPGHFMVWLSSPEAKFLKGKFVWANWDVDELKSRAKEIENSNMLTINLEGWPFEKK